MTSNKVIQSLWIGNQLSNMERLCIESYLQNGHEFHLYTFADNLSNIPEKTEVYDGNEIIPKDRIFTDSINSFASFSDWFRYRLLFERGGWWVDMDTICIKPFNFRSTYCFATEEIVDGNTLIANCYIKAPRKADFLGECLQYIDKFLEENRTVPWGAFGPHFLTTVLSTYDCKRFIKETQVFCPIHWSDIHKFISKQEIAFHDSTFAIHLWNEIWRRGNLDKNAVYHPDSIYEMFKIRYGL